MAGAEIPRFSAPCATEFHCLCPRMRQPPFASRHFQVPNPTLGFSRQRYESNSGRIYRDRPWNSRPATADTNCIEGQQFSEFDCLVLSSSGDDANLEQQQADQLMARQVDVLIVASVQSQGEVFRQIQQHKTPVVLIDRRFRGVASHFVGVDDIQAGRLASEHLSEIGCRHLAHIAGPDVSTAAGRLKGYREVLARMRIISSVLMNDSRLRSGRGP